MKITLKDQTRSGDRVWGFRIEAQNGRAIHVQSDWDFTNAARAFGWSPCPCGRTDGTIRCEHRTVREMIWEAFDFCQENIGKEVDDPGYF